MLLWRLSSAVSFIHSQANIKAWREPVSSLQQLDKAATTQWSHIRGATSDMAAKPPHHTESHHQQRQEGWNMDSS